MRIYPIARYSRKHELREVRAKLESLGHVVQARWLDEPDGQSFEEATEDQLAEYAANDWEDLEDAAVVLYFSGSGRHGGMHVEFGLALGSDTDIIIIGERENLYHYLGEIYSVHLVDTLDDAIALMAEWERINAEIVKEFGGLAESIDPYSLSPGLWVENLSSPCA